MTNEPSARGPVLRRSLHLLSGRGLLAVWLGALALAAALPLTPLARAPGFESALVATVLAVILGGCFGVGAMRREKTTGDESSALAAYAAALLPVFCVVGVVAVAAILGTLLGPGCSPVRGLTWYLLLPIPSALLATALGCWTGALCRKAVTAGLLFALCVLASVTSAALPILFGPQVFLYDHFLGYFPGPIYDERVAIEKPLLIFRGLTLCWSALLVGVLALSWRGEGLGWPRPRTDGVAVLLLSLAPLAWAAMARGELGYVQSDARIAAALGGRSEGERCTLLHPREMEREKVRRLLLECDLRVEQLEDFFAVEAPRPTVFLYRSREEKRRLTGAAATQFAKPWLGQIHIDPRGHPHPILKHELAHLITAPLGRRPFGVSAVGMGLVPLQGLIEGAAVAADWPADELTIHEKAAALRRIRLAPRLERILAARGFWTESASRAYTYAGSFVRWLVDEEGPASFARLYRDGDFLAAYGEPLPALLARWEAFLDELPLDDRQLAIAERRFRRPSIFRRPCAREVADLRREAQVALRAKDTETAVELYRRCAALDPGDPAHLRSEALAWRLAGDAKQLLAIAQRLEEEEGHPGLRAELWLWAGDALALQGGESAGGEARDAYERAASLLPDQATARALAVRLEASADPELARAALPYLRDGSQASLLAVRELLDERPDWGSGWYLVGRRLLQLDDHEAALRDLERALAAGLPSSLDREARRLRALTLAALARYDEACPALEALLPDATPGDRLQLEDDLALCHHAATRPPPP